MNAPKQNPKHPRLGKGLAALLGENLGTDDPTRDNGGPRELPVADIAPNPFQPRREFDEEELRDLTDSIRENGLLQPIAVRPGRGGTPWELIAGERRWRAVTRLGWRDIPAVIRDVDDRTLLVLALVENLQRSELSPLEEAAGYKQLVDEFGWSQQRVAEAVGRDRSTVANALRLLQLPASVRHLLLDGKLTSGHARALLGLDDERRIAEIAQKAAAQGWSVREVEAEVQRLRAPRAAKPETKNDAGERRLEEELQRALGTAARIRKTRGMKGRIEIPFYNAEDFERIFEQIVGKQTTELI